MNTAQYGGLHVLVLGTADWNQPIATNQHFATREMAKIDGVSVTFVESMGLRTPTFSTRDISRILGRIGRLVRRAAVASHERTVPPNVTVVSPLVIPRHTGPWARINQLLLRWQLRRWLADERGRILWTYTPATYGLHARGDRAFYHCVDLLAEVPGVDSVVVAEGERALAAAGVEAAATSDVVGEHLRAAGFKRVHLWENVADTQLIDRVRESSVPTRAKRAIFAGNMTAAKVDFGILQHLVEAGIEVALAGPVAEGGGDRSEFDRVVESGATYLGMLGPEQLAHELLGSAVGLIPYKLNNYTRGVSPLKTYEYLRAGLSVVSTPMPGVSAHSRSISLCESREDFLEVVTRMLDATREEDIESRIAEAAPFSWNRRGREIRAVILKPGGTI